MDYGQNYTLNWTLEHVQTLGMSALRRLILPRWSTLPDASPLPRWLVQSGHYLCWLLKSCGAWAQLQVKLWPADQANSCHLFWKRELRVSNLRDQRWTQSLFALLCETGPRFTSQVTGHSVTPATDWQSRLTLLARCLPRVPFILGATCSEFSLILRYETGPRSSRFLFWSWSWSWSVHAALCDEEPSGFLSLERQVTVFIWIENQVPGALSGVHAVSLRPLGRSRKQFSVFDACFAMILHRDAQILVLGLSTLLTLIIYTVCTNSTTLYVCIWKCCSWKTCWRMLFK